MAQTIIVDISTRGANPVAYTHQGDTGRTFFAEIYENGEAFAVAGYTIKVGAILPADRGYTVIAGNDMVTATKTNDNTTNKIYFTLSNKYSLKAGNGILTLIFTSNTGTPSTIRPINIDLKIQKSADADDTIAGASDFPDTLEEIAEEVLENLIYREPISLTFTSNAYSKRLYGGEVVDNAGIFKISNPIPIEQTLFNVITVDIENTQTYCNEVTFLDTDDIANLTDSNIVGYYKTGTQGQTATVNVAIPEGARFVVFTTYGNPDVSVVDSARFDLNYVLSTIENTVESVADDPENIFFGGFVDKYYIAPDGTIYGNGSYCYPQEFIPVEKGTYICNRYIRFVTMYDVNKNPVSAAGISSEMDPYTPFNVPAGISYIRPSFQANTIGGYVIINKGETITDEIKQGKNAEKSVYNSRQARGALGNSGVIKEAGSVSAGANVTVETFPYYIKKNTFMNYYGTFSSFSSLKLGFGYSGNLSGWIEITPTAVKYNIVEGSTSIVNWTHDHGLTISSYIAVSMYRDADGMLKVIINTLSGTYSVSDTAGFYYMYGVPFANSETATANVKITVGSADIKKPIWIIGDSYLGFDSSRILGQLKNLGYADKALIVARSGLDSETAWGELQKLLKLGTPKFLVWYISLNDSQTTYFDYAKQLSQLCNELDIELILNCAPSIPSQDTSQKNYWIKNTGRRYVDSALAVGSTASGVWYSYSGQSFLNSDNVHPSELGAKALAEKMLIDVPELLQA